MKKEKTQQVEIINNVQEIINNTNKQEIVKKKEKCSKCWKSLDWYCICWRNHWNSTFNSIKFKNIIDLVKRDVELTHALATNKVLTGTFYNRINRDKNLLDELELAKANMHVLTSNVISNSIADGNDKLAMERKKKRDHRYIDKTETHSTQEIKISKEDEKKIQDVIEHITN